MLPLLPALILLLLQGPSNIERLAHEGRLQGALQAVHAQLQRPALAADDQRKVLAELLAKSGDAGLARALTQLLTLVLDEPGDNVQVRSRATRETALHGLSPTFAADLADGFLACRRTRDGP
jgi:protein involved in temperature-dependent protein secretion